MVGIVYQNKGGDPVVNRGHLRLQFRGELLSLDVFLDFVLVDLQICQHVISRVFLIFIKCLRIDADEVGRAELHG